MIKIIWTISFFIFENLRLHHALQLNEAFILVYNAVYHDCFHSSFLIFVMSSAMLIDFDVLYIPWPQRPNGEC